MQKLLYIFFSCFVSLSLFSQKITIQGRVYDSIINKGLAYTTVSLVRQIDSTLVSFSRADSAGNFKMNGVEKGKYLISTSYVGYIAVWKPIEIIGNSNPQDIGDVYMQDLSSAGEVTVNTKRPPVTINNDTLEFNTENFKTQPNAVVEDMLKKMPGVTVETDGTVKVNGQTVKRVLVNGKEFFTGDIKMATKNLPADAVDKVQVFDKQSDQSSFTGVDDGNAEKTINLKLKKDKANALFGKIAAGAGNDKRYDAQTNINKFKGDEQLFLIAMANNTNRQGFSISDVLNFTGEMSRGMRNGGGIVIRTDDDNDNSLPITGLGQNQQGVANTTAGGLNYNNAWNKNKTDLNANYTGSDIHLLTNKQINTQYIAGENSYNRFQTSNSINDNTQHRLNAILDQKIDSSLSLKITSAATWQQTSKQTASTYTSEDLNKIKLNEGYSNSTSNADAFNLVNTALLRKKFKKKGRTLSLNINSTYNHSTSAGTLYSENKFYTDAGSNDSLINQTNSRDAITRNGGANLTYTEPIGKKSLLEFSSFINANIGNSNKQTYDYNTASGKHDVLNTRLSNDFKSNYTYAGGSINFRTNMKKINLTVGSSLQSATLRITDNTHSQNTLQNFTDLLPNAMLQYNISKMKNIRLQYSTSTTQPGIAQLQPVADVSDPLNIIIGNPLLKRQYNHNIMLNFFAADPIERKNLFAFFNFTTSSGNIVQAQIINPNGSRISTYTNANGIYNLMGNINYGFPLKKLKSRIEIGTSTTLGKSVSYINAQRNNISNTSFGPNIAYDFNLEEKLDIRVTARLNFSSSKYSLQQNAGNNYLQQRYGLEMVNYFPGKITVSNEFNYTINSGRFDGFNTSIPLWNVSAAKSLLKNNRGEIKFSIADLLKKNTGISRSSNLGYITDEKYNVLQRYFLLTFTYSLNKSGLHGGPRTVIRTLDN
ncbi:outer membrane beta-barrel protein [Panacibacter ginsenosidivorans]|uniref:Outer membrane beta-barrel protein n=1 Tax=Panacibacter ginsenosidivorans TaxID=1813871 RepID=A0A5B8V8Z8_9BACT|nr:outer membrane beta-barrel protein [Panacibacter ginsenosidivorans]QEC67990.1 outer membrane beta-barrel protein [Panacibacter ginsenosidivorans]